MINATSLSISQLLTVTASPVRFWRGRKFAISIDNADYLFSMNQLIAALESQREKNATNSAELTQAFTHLKTINGTSDQLLRESCCCTQFLTWIYQHLGNRGLDTKEIQFNNLELRIGKSEPEKKP